MLTAVFTPSPLPPPLNVVYCGTMLGFAQLSFVVNIDRWGKGRAETEVMYGVDVFLYGRELCPNEIIRRLYIYVKSCSIIVGSLPIHNFAYHYKAIICISCYKIQH